MADGFERAQAPYSKPFLYPVFPYRGHRPSEHVSFDAALQAFAQKVSVVSNLQTNGKLACEEAYAQIEGLWQQLRQSHQQLLWGSQAERSAPLDGD